MEPLDPDRHKQYIDAYASVYGAYKMYADALERVLKRACAVSVPEAVVQTRPKGVASFAEKCVRKHDKYPDPVNQMTDLCGGRVIVQTLDQVTAVRQFIEANFEIVDKDDKGLLLGTDEFGYRDMHYVVRVRAGRGEALGFTPDELTAIGGKPAEIQVRTWLQHAWADTLHDRMYKTKLTYPDELNRVGALLAALMEDGDRAFSRLASDVDGMQANYSAHAPKEDVDREIAVQQTLLDNAELPEKPGVALRLAALVAAEGEHKRVVELLSDFADLTGPLRVRIQLALGDALCRLHRATHDSAEYRRGQDCLREAVDLCAKDSLDAVPNVRQRTSLHARAQARLAWSWEVVPGEEEQARNSYQKALELEPTNPYYLADVLGYEIYCTRNTDVAGSMRAVLATAVATCREHALARTETPNACFTAGRLSLLLGKDYEALGWYARGVRHLLEPDAIASADHVGAEIAWLDRVYGARRTDAYGWTKRYLNMALSALPAGATPRRRTIDVQRTPLPVSSPVLMVSGGAASLAGEASAEIEPCLRDALRSFSGTAISGGTAVGVPGCVGGAAAELAEAAEKRFGLLGYVTEKRRADAPLHGSYDHVDESGADFTPEHLLRGWQDVLAAGVNPADVRLLGFGGGRLSALEYRLALGLGAQVAVVDRHGGAALALLNDPVWRGTPNLLPVPFDPCTIRAFVVPPPRVVPEGNVDKMARAFHERYVDGSVHRLPENMRPWDKLPETYKRANREQARYAVEILAACGFDVRPVDDTAPSVPPIQFMDEEVERMAEMEHARWNVERLRDGWRPGARDDQAKVHDCIVPWTAKSLEDTKCYDREAVRAFPDILARAGLQVNRREIQ